MGIGWCLVTETDSALDNLSRNKCVNGYLMASRNIWRAEETDSRLHLQAQPPKLFCRTGTPRQLFLLQPLGSHLPNQEAASQASGSGNMLLFMSTPSKCTPQFESIGSVFRGKKKC